MVSARAGPARATLSRLIDNLGPGVVSVVLAPAGLDVAIGQACIYDRGDGPIEPSDVVLGVGVEAASGDAVELLARAGAARAAAVVLKLRSHASPVLLKAAECAEIALLDAVGGVAWGQLHTLIRTATATSGEVAEASYAAAPVGDLFALANAVAAMIGGPTTIEDRHSTVLAYSRHDVPIDDGRRQTILGRRIPDEWMERLHADGVFRRLWDSDDVIRLDYSSHGLRPRMVIAVRADLEILGTIWVAEGSTPFNDDAAAALREAARIAALHLIRHRSSEDLERRQQAESLRAVLETRTAPDQLAATLGVPTDAPVTVLAFQVPTSERTELSVELGRVVNLVALYCEAFRRQVATVAIGAVVYVLVPSPQPAGVPRGRLVDLAGEIVKQAQRALEISLRAAVGSTVEHFGELPRSRREADQILRVLADRRHDHRVGDIDDLRSDVVLAELCDLAAGQPALRAGKLNVLLELDRDGRKGYVETLAAYLDTFGDIPAAAKRLGIHHNTFRYRLQRLQEQSGLNLDDPVERLVTELQLHIRPASRTER